MGIKLKCPKCGKDYDVHPALAGQPLDCSDCGVNFTVPTSSAPSESSDKEAEVVIEESGAVACPGCGVRYAVEGLASGMQVECSDCGASFSIQLHDAPQSSPATEPTSNPVSPGAAVSDAPAGKKSSTLSVVSLVLGLAGIPFCGLTAIPAIICGHLALGRIKKGHGDGRGMALTGVISGYVFGIGALCLFALFTQAILTMFTNFPEHAEREVVYEKYKELLASIDTCVADSDSVLSLAAKLEKIEKPKELLLLALAKEEPFSSDLFDEENWIGVTKRVEGECTARFMRNGSGYGQLNGKPIIIIEYDINLFVHKEGGRVDIDPPLTLSDAKYCIIYLRDTNESSSNQKNEEIKDEGTGSKVDTGKERAILEKELRYTKAQFAYLGGYMRRNFPNHSVLLIAPPKIAGSSQYAENRLSTIKKALKDGYGYPLTISGTVHLESPEAQDGMPPTFTADAVDEIVYDNPEANLILSLVGLPVNWRQMNLWLMQDGKRPKLVITNAEVYELYDPIIQGYINAVVHHKPSSEYNFQDSVPYDVTEAFEKRYLLIDADNIAEIATENEGMFAKSP